MIVDMAVHPVVGDVTLKELVGSPWADVDALPQHLGSRYAPPFAELLGAEDEVGDPVAVARAVFDEIGVDVAVLTPLSRGLLPNPQQSAAVAHALNRCLSGTWLGLPEAEGRYFGSIRVPMDDVSAAVREIEAWGRDERFVQVVVPLRVFAPYGDAHYFPVWQVASELGLTVYVHDDYANTIEPRPTSVGYPRYFAEAHAQRPLAGIFHLSSLITSGTFDRLPELRFVFGDGGLDLCHPMLWRLDKDWRSGRVEVPWVERKPSSYVDQHARFVTQPEDGRPDGRTVDADWQRIAAPDRLALFGSHYPYWGGVDPRQPDEWPEYTVNRVLSTNALEFMPRLARGLAVSPVPREVPHT